MSNLPNYQDVPLEKRRQLLTSLPDFSKLPPTVILELANALKVEVFPVGGNVVEEREIADRMYILVSGIAEATTMGPKGKVVLDQITAGEMFGELALVSKIKRRKATVTAVTQLVSLSLSAESFDKTMQAYPTVLEGFLKNAEVLMHQKLQKVSPMH